MTRSLTPRLPAIDARKQQAASMPRAFEALARALVLVMQNARQHQQPLSIAPPQVPQFLTLPEASKYMGLSMAFIRRLIQSKKLPVLRDGLSWKVRKTDLDNLPDVAQLAECSKKLNHARVELRTVMQARRAATR